MKKNKKGFTLAELLIVVAIIAVLTAIAVPLFVGSLNKAKDSVKEANIRAVRGAAVVHILEESAKGAPANSTDATKDGIWTGTKVGSTENYSYSLVGPWYATATLDKSGNIKKLVVNLTKVAEEYTEGDTEIKVVVEITELKATAT